MKLKDLKNGMSFECRGKAKYFIINGKIYRDKGTLIPTGVFEERMKGYSDDLLITLSDGEMDIMKVYDIDNKLIWERKEVDWSKIPVDTKVLVRNSQDQEWGCRYFAKYENGKIYAFMNGVTSWSMSAWGDIVPWEEAKLVEDKKMENIDIEKINNQYEKYCKSRGCPICKYYGKLSCRFAWLLDNYNVTPRKEI